MNFSTIKEGQMKKVYDEVIDDRTNEILNVIYPRILSQYDTNPIERAFLNLLAGIQARQEVIIDELVAMQK